MRARLVVVGVLIVYLVAACDGGDEDVPRVARSESPSASPSSESPSDEPTKKPPKKDGGGKKEKDEEPDVPDVDPPNGFEVVSEKAWTRCTAGAPLKGSCPTVVPKTKRNYLVEAFGKPGGRFGVLEMSTGAPRGAPGANKPPAFAHVVLEAGPERFLIDFGATTAEATLSDGLLHQTRSGAILLGKRKWGGRSGRLLLAEPFPGGGAHGDHLVFQWKRGGVIHRISLHAWIPTAKAEKTMKTIISSMQ